MIVYITNFFCYPLLDLSQGVKKKDCKKKLASVPLDCLCNLFAFSGESDRLFCVNGLAHPCADKTA